MKRVSPLTRIKHETPAEFEELSIIGRVWALIKLEFNCWRWHRHLSHGHPDDHLDGCPGCERFMVKLGWRSEFPKAVVAGQD